MDFSLYSLLFVPLGIAIGAAGTLIGVGGGFILVPVLILLYPDESPELLTSISLAVIFFNALSGSIAYARMRRVDYKSGWMFAAATVPGAILGSLTTALLPRHVFDLILGSLMVAACTFLLLRPAMTNSGKTTGKRFHITRVMVEADGTRYTYSFNPAVGVVISLFVGYLSSLLGIGGGIIHVPVLVYLLGFPVHIATATSQFVLVIMTFTGALTHVVSGVFTHGIWLVIFLAIGVIAGAQYGARLSNRIHGKWIIRGLGIALGLVGIRIIILAL